MVLKGLYIWLVHQDLQKKKEIEIVKRSRTVAKCLQLSCSLFVTSA